MESQKRSGQFTEKNILVIDSNTGYGSACTAEFRKKGYDVTEISAEKESDLIKQAEERGDNGAGMEGKFLSDA